VNSANARGGAASAPILKSNSRMQIAYVVISSLVVCSLLAIALATVDFSTMFGGGDDNSENFVDDSADIIAEQETVVAQSPDDVNEIVFLANLLGNTGRINEAVPYYERAVTLAPDDLGIRLDFARTLSDAGLRKDAETQFLVVIQADPENQNGHYYLAELYRAWDPPRTDEAIAHYRRVVDIDTTTFVSQLAQDQLDSLAPGSPGTASPEAEGTP
jgi:cytochrome c-type biogenesis protein CcmH/NrfG